MSARIHALNDRLLPGRLWHGPRWLVLGVNNLCNLRCKTCDVGTGYTDSNFYHHLVGAAPRDMPRDLLWRVIDQAAVAFPRTRLGFAFTEPLLYPHLADAVAYARDKGLASTVTTNGFTLPQKADALAEAGLAALYLSLDGPPEVHDRIRGRARSFERAVAGMQALAPRVPVSVYCTLSEWNQGRLREFLECLRPLPVTGVGFMHPNYIDTSMADAHNAAFPAYPAGPSNLAEMNPGTVDLDALQAEIADIRAHAWPFPVTFSPDIHTRAELARFYRDGTSLMGTHCHDAFSALMIKSDGSVIPAHGRCYRVVAGNLHESSLTQLWNAAPLAAFRRTLRDAGGLLPGCARCCSGFQGYRGAGA